MKKAFVLLLLLFLPIFSTVNATDVAKYPEGLLAESSKVLMLTPAKRLLVDSINNQIQVLDLNTQKVLWSKNFPVIYDSQVLMNPLKIIVITSENNKLQKITFSANGDILTKQAFNSIKLSEDQIISWSPPVNQDKEKLAVVNKRNILVYQYPWKTHNVTLSSSLPDDKKYELAIIKNVQFQQPYVVIKFNGDNSTQSQDFYRIVNISTKKKLTIPVQWNSASNFTVEGNELVVNTSSQIGHPLGITTNVDQIIYARYNLRTGEMNTSIKRSFISAESNWKSHYVNHQLLLIDSEKRKLSLFNQKGNILIETSLIPTDLISKFIGYYNQQLYNLTPSENNSSELITTPFN